VDQNRDELVRSLRHVGSAAHGPQISLALRAGLAVGGVCLVAKDVAQAVQPLMIRSAVDSFRGGSGMFFRYAGFLVALALVKASFSIGCA